MKKLITFIIAVVFLSLFPSCQGEVIEASVSMTNKVPREFFGSWRVVSTCVKSTNKQYFGSKSLDLWVLARMGDVISLTNPLSGAKADVSVKDVKGSTVKFEKYTYFPDEQSTETPILTLQGDKFSGVDKIVIKTFKNGELIKEDYVEYQVRGTRISGMGVNEIFGR